MMLKIKNLKRIIISGLIMVLSITAFSQTIEGKWTGTIDTDNGPFTFFAEYEVDGETLTGVLYSENGIVKIFDGTFKDNEFEYSYEIEYKLIRHEGKLVDGELKIKMHTNDGETEITMTPAREE